MATIQVTPREFREKQKSFFDLADKGDKIVIRRGSRKSYVLTQVEEPDPYFTPEIMAKIDKAIQQVKEGKVHEMKPHEDLTDFLNRVRGCIE